MTEIENYAEKDVELCLIGNKSDSTEPKVIDANEGQVNELPWNLFLGICQKEKHGVFRVQCQDC